MPSSTTNACSWNSSAPPKRLHDLRQHADDEEVAADDEDRQRRAKDGRRRMHVDLGPSGSGVGQRQEQAADQERTGLDAPQGDVRRGEEDGLAPNVEPGAEDHDQGQHHVLDPPAHRPDRRSKGLLEVHQDQDERNEEDGVQHVGHRHRTAVARHRPARFRRRPEPVDRESRATGRSGSRPTRASGTLQRRQELTVVAARVGQAETQPDHRNEALDDERTPSASDQPLPSRWRAG